MIRELWKKYQSVIAYLFFGGLTTLVNLVTYWIFFNVIGWPLLISNSLAWFISVLFAYITNKLWVFNSHVNGLWANLREMSSFFGFRILSLGVDDAIMWVGIDLLHGNSLIVKLIDQVIIVILNWFFSKLFIFRKRS